MAPWLHFFAFAHIFRLYLFFTVTCCYLLLFTYLICFQADEFAKGLLALGLEPGVSSMAVIASPTIYSGVAMFVAANSIGVQFAVRITSCFSILLLYSTCGSISQFLPAQNLQMFYCLVLHLY